MQSQGNPSPIRAAQEPDRPHRRARIPVSCDSCRTRKLRCNREKPCQNCTARAEQAGCKFRASKNGVVATPVTHRDTNGDTTSIHQRIDHLEDLVKRLIAEGPRDLSPSKNVVYTPESPHTESEQALSSAPSDAPNMAGAGQTVMDGIHSVYVGGDDWNAVLQQVNELKRTWRLRQQDNHSDENLHPTLSHTVDGSSLLFNQVKPIERIEILSTLPPKPEVDRLISRFFDGRGFPINVPPLLHKPTFMHEYNEQWRDLSQANFIWLGLLFSILSITMLAFHQYGEPPEYEGISESLFQLYRIRTAQCLLSGDIAKCLPYTVETLRFNATAELNRKDDNCRGLWIMTGVMARAAINMGYHRDPSQSSGISVLQAEYRRRVWLSVTSMDDLASFLGGFPRMMLAIHADTAEPRNLYDWELSDDMTILPPSRPLAEITPATYLIVKGRLFSALGRVADFNSTSYLGSYETVLEIDRVLYNAHENFPPHMRVVPIKAGNSVIPTIADFSNMSLEGMYYKGMCTLHRRFLVKGRVDGRYKFSRDRCISSALAILAFQQGLEPSFYQLSQTRQILTLGAIILFLELELRRQAPDAEASPDSGVLLQALQKSCALWARAVDTSDEVERVYQFLAKLLSGCEAGIGTDAGSSRAVLPAIPPDHAGLSEQVDAANGRFSFEKDLINMDVDWATLDTFIEETSYETGPLDSIVVDLSKDYM
ncbi:uncharacterized protein V1518DRAFT_370393 [Limtongia smithiae]|uniref:uncharacterized protein n=1 Tax=Limtongia smithiae TaxID=1125753 RepID=UPI0034CFB734